MQTQAALAAFDLAVEMCTRPWIVEFSRNSHIAEVTILGSIHALKVMKSKAMLFIIDAQLENGTVNLEAGQCMDLVKELQSILSYLSYLILSYLILLKNFNNSLNGGQIGHRQAVTSAVNSELCGELGN